VCIVCQGVVSPSVYRVFMSSEKKFEECLDKVSKYVIVLEYLFNVVNHESS